MNKSEFLGLNLPSRDGDDIADINVVSQNFEIVDEFLKNFKAPEAITKITETCNVWELESGIYSVDTDATGAMVSLSNAGDYMLYGLLLIADTTSSYGGKTFLILGCDESYMSVARIGVVEENGTANYDFPNGHLLASSNVISEFDIEREYSDDDIYNANAVKEGLLLFAEMIEQMAAHYTDLENRISALEQQASGSNVTPADTLYQHFGVDKAEYPFLFVAHDISSSRSSIEVSFAKSYSVNSSGTIMLTDFLRAKVDSIAPAIVDTADAVVGGTIAHLPASSLTTTASGYVNHSTRDNTYTNTEVEGASADKYTFVMI